MADEDWTYVKSVQREIAVKLMRPLDGIEIKIVELAVAIAERDLY